jgi:hypothetical protein
MIASGRKQEWVRPELQKLDAGSAESNETGVRVDNSSPQRS